MLTFGSLFAGIGGFDLGFERAGMECRWQVEIDDYATRVLEKHWPKVRRHRDVRSWPEPDTERVDVISGGFPCQDISYAGSGDGIHGERSRLFFECVRVVGQLRPRVLVLENSAALLSRGLGQVLGPLAEVGMDAEWHCFQAADLGAPHLRDRCYIIAYSNADSRGREEFWESQHCDQQGTPRGVTDGLRQRGLRERARRVLTTSKWWSVEPDVGRMAHGIPRRVDRLKCLGNAVVPQAAERIGRWIIEDLKRKSP